MTLAWDLDSDLSSITFLDDDSGDDLSIIDDEDLLDFEILSEDKFASSPSRDYHDIRSDQCYRVIIDPHTLQHKQLSVNKLSGNSRGLGRVVWTNASITGKLYHVTNGNIVVSATCGDQTRSRTFSLTGIPTANEEWQYDVEGWVREDAVSNVDSRLGGEKAIYTTLDHTTPTYVRNEDCWVADLDLTCISPWNSTGADLRGGVLITPCHLLFAKHYPISIGATVRFVTSGNVVVDRTVEDSWLHGDSDLALLKFTEDVPSTITFAKCLPSNFADYIVGYRGIPLVSPDKNEDMILQQMYNINSSNSVTTEEYPSSWTEWPRNEDRLLYYKEWVTGDSGSPLFMIINGELAILGCAHLSRSCPAVHSWFDVINSALGDLGGGYSLTSINLNSFNSV